MLNHKYKQNPKHRFQYINYSLIWYYLFVIKNMKSRYSGNSRSKEKMKESRPDLPSAEKAINIQIFNITSRNNHRNVCLCLQRNCSPLPEGTSRWTSRSSCMFRVRTKSKGEGACSRGEPKVIIQLWRQKPQLDALWPRCAQLLTDSLEEEHE